MHKIFALTAWSGSLEKGSGQVELTSSGVPVSKALTGVEITLDASLAA